MKGLEFPRYVFKSPGDVRYGLTEGSYGSQIAESQDEFDALLKAGWSEGIEEAVEASKVVAPENRNGTVELEEKKPEEKEPEEKKKGLFGGR
jgi:hypothetical protein